MSAQAFLEISKSEYILVVTDGENNATSSEVPQSTTYLLKVV